MRTMLANDLLKQAYLEKAATGGDTGGANLENR
jgi:hypothetical protein